MSIHHHFLSDEQCCQLRLIRSPYIGPATYYYLLQRYGSAKEAIAALPDISLRAGGRPIVLVSRDQIEQEIELTHQFGAFFLFHNDPHYPHNLSTIDSPPPVLTVYSQTYPQIFQPPMIAIIGARHASANGCRLAFAHARDLAPHATIVSGLARGIDTAAHQGALQSGQTIAVTACGIDHIYPPENHTLYHNIAERGAILTEMPFGTPPKSQFFPKRNRIISGLALALLVIEAGLQSGSLITANMAVEHNREVFAVPGFPLDARCQGTNLLIKQGAALLDSLDDVIALLPSTLPSSLKRNCPLQESVVTALPVSDDDLQSIHHTLLSLLSATPMSIEELLMQSQIPINQLMTAIFEGELTGKMIRHPGNKISLFFHKT